MTKKIIKTAFCLSLVLAATAFGQDDAAAEAAVNVQKTTLWQMIKQGGWAMWPLGLMSMAMVYFIVQNALALREKVLLRPDLIPEFIQLMKDKKILEAHSLCKENETLFTYVFSAGLERCSVNREINFDKVKTAIEEASSEEITSYMKPIDYLSIIGATAPMLGLLGTVSGMIKAFQTIGSQGMGKPEVLAGNIGEALVTTATGLLIAIPSMLAYYYFRNSFIKSTATLGRNIGGLLDTLETGELPLGFKGGEE
ncbi:MotA/TolQ/ExbB proton channel family protein [Verrucomicrobia bacterium S94]|nr:MotA/TolQ/ExbB proton channel family protein [Verrucomicrobia bacterium S94]